MLRHMKKAFGQQVRLGKLRLRAWIVLGGAAIVLAAVGQAAGPMLAGLVGGSAGVTVSQTLRLTADSSVYANAGANDAVLTINDEGTGFTAALELNLGGEDNLLALNISNSSDKAVNAVLTLEFPPGLEVEMEEELGTDVGETQLNTKSWLVTLTADSDDEDLEITIKAKDIAAPGFYTIRGKLVQTGG